MRPLPFRTHPRWDAYDYTIPGTYFVTAVTHARNPIFGTIIREGIALSKHGESLRRIWTSVSNIFAGVAIDTFVVMPDHMHALIELSAGRDRTAGLSQVIGWVKQRATREIRSSSNAPSGPIWQRSFHDRVVRDADALAQIRRYIADNPRKAWEDRHRAVEPWTP